MIFQPKPSAGGREPRYHSIDGAFPGELKVRGAPVALVPKCVDVSREGIGALTEIKLTRGQIVDLDINARVIQLEVMYSIADLIHHGKFRSGFRRVRSSDNLLELFRQCGCVAPTEAV